MAAMQITDNGDGTLSSPDVTDNGDGTLSSADVTDAGGILSPTVATVTRDVEVSASPVFSGWHTMGTTGYPITLGPVNADNGYTAGSTSIGLWQAAQLVNQWSAGPIWIQES